jgi:PhnB protein
MTPARQRIVPMLSYEDAAAAIRWLCDAFGFEEDPDVRHTSSDGRVTHAELAFEGARIMLANPTPEYRSPKRHRETCADAAAWLDNPWVVDGLFVEVGDLDSHYDRARRSGATILREPNEPGVGFRIYTAEDPEGHRWMFGEPTA